MKFKNGYMIEIHSWENDYDYVSNHNIYGLTKEEAKSIGTFLSVITAVNEQVLSDDGNLKIRDACNQDVLNYATRDWRNTIDVKELQDIEFWNSIRTEVIAEFGLFPMNPEFYDIRIVDSIETVYAEFKE